MFTAVLLPRKVGLLVRVPLFREEDIDASVLLMREISEAVMRHLVQLHSGSPGSVAIIVGYIGEEVEVGLDVCDELRCKVDHETVFSKCKTARIAKYAIYVVLDCHRPVPLLRAFKTDMHPFLFFLIFTIFNTRMPAFEDPRPLNMLGPLRAIVLK